MILKNDSEILHSINEVLSKSDFDGIVEDLRQDHKWHYRDLEKFRALRALMSEQENEFASDVLQDIVDHLHLAVQKMIDFSGVHFFVCDRHFRAEGGEFLYRLYPRLREKIVEGDAKAQALWDQHLATLEKLCDNLTLSYGGFHRATKAHDLG